MALDDLASSAPKSLRPALWVIAFALSAGAVALVGMSAIEGKAQVAATTAVVPLVERITKLETGQATMWQTVDSKLNSISTELTQTRTDVAVLSQKVEDSKSVSKGR